jgi:hypothetical protein
MNRPTAASPIESPGALRETDYGLIRSGQRPSVCVGAQLRTPRRTLAQRLAETRGGWPTERTDP